MSLLFLVIIYIIYTTTSQTITANGDDIICSTSQSQCTVNCIDTNCNKIKIYSSSNKTIINCNSPLSCINTDLICIGNYNQCILSCTNIHSCTNSTLTCNDKSNNNACRCEGIGCPPTEPALITNHIYDANEDKIADTETETQTEGDNNNYKMNESVLIMFFVGFFIVVLCCFCILIVALSFIGLYFSEKKKNNDSKYKISFGSSDGNREQIGPLKYEKSEATHRMSYFSHKNMSYDTCHKNMSYDTTISMYNNDDEKDDITEHHLNIPKQIINQQQQQLINQQQQQIINHQQQQIINQQQQQQQQVINHQQQQIINQPPQQHIIDIEQLINEEKRDQHNKSVNVNLAEQLGNQFETENKMQMQEESRTQTEIQHEGILKNKQVSKSVSNRNHQKFDSEDLYITAQTTINDDEKDNEYENENKINDDDKKSIDDIGSDDECLPELDGNQFHTLDGHNRLNLSIMNHSDSGNYTLDGHNRNVINNNNNNNTNNNNMNDLKLQPDDIMVSVSNDNGLDDINADISAQLPFSPAVPVAAADTITKHPPKKLLLHPPTIKGDQRGNKHKNIDMYLGSEGNQSQTGSLKKNEIETENDDEKVVKIDEEKEDQDHLCIVRLGNMNGRYHSYDEEDYKKTTNPLHDNMTGVERMPLMHGNTSNTETISTFTIKSNPGSLSRTTSLNSAAAVRVAFPTESSSTQFKANRTSYYNIINKQNKNITNYITHKNNNINIKHTKKHTKKHRNYYSEQFYNFTPQLVQFEPQNNKSMEDMNKTPPNSNRTDLSISNITTVGTEKPLILNNTSTDNNLDVSHKAISSSMIVTLPISPHNMNINNNINNNMNGHRHNSYYSNITDELPPPPPHISLPDELPPPHILIPDENVKRSRPKSSRKKKKSSSSRSKSRSTSHRDSIGSGNTITTKKSKSRSSRSTTSSNNTYILSSSSQDSKKGSKRNSKKHRKRSSPKSPSINNTYRRNTTKSLKTIKTNTNTSTNHNPSQIVIKTKHKIRRNRHESVSSYSKNNNDDMDRDIHKYSNGNVTRNVKIKRSSKLMLKQSYDQNITIPIKTSKSVNVPKIDINLHANSLNPKWSQKRVMMTPPVDIHHIPNGSKRNRSKYENRGFGDLIPSQSMFVRNIIK